MAGPPPRRPDPAAATADRDAAETAIAAVTAVAAETGTAIGAATAEEGTAVLGGPERSAESDAAGRGEARAIGRIANRRVEPAAGPERDQYIRQGASRLMANPSTSTVSRSPVRSPAEPPRAG